MNGSTKELIKELIIPEFFFFIYSRDSSARHCVGIVRRNSVLIIHGSSSVNKSYIEGILILFLFSMHT